MQVSPRQAIGLTSLVLLCQHLALFAPHYSGGATFFRDFTNIYYPLTAFWLSWVGEGVFPHWAPLANMGLPFALTLQSGLFYPPLWLFAVGDGTAYSLQVANMVSALHVLLGAWGAWCYARLMGLSRGPACFVAVAFQFMGCLYNNLQHPDMIRAYAWLPWLFWAAHVDPHQRVLSLRQWLLPAIVALFATGAYQGNLIAHSFVLTVFCLLSWLKDMAIDRSRWRHITLLYARVAALALLGLMLVAVYLWPTYGLMEYQTRSTGTLDFRHYWDLTYWHTLIMPSNLQGTYVWWAMISAFVTAPVFALLFFLRMRFIRQEWLWVATTLLSLSLAAGRSSPVYTALVELFPMLGFSRLLSSDYRGLFCFGLILLSGKVLEEYLRGGLRAVYRRAACLCLGLLAFYLLLGLLGEMVQQHGSIAPAELERYRWVLLPMYSLLQAHAASISVFYLPHWLIATGMVTLVFVALWVFRNRPRDLLVGLLALELLSGFTQWYQEKPDWRLEQSADTYFRCVGPHQRLPSLSVLGSASSARPACRAEGGEPMDAYVCGEYLCNVKDALNVTPRVAVEKLPGGYDFMIQPPRAAVLSEPEAAHCDLARVPDILSRSAPIEQVSFGLQEVHYQVRSAENFCFVENELYFPGWSGRVTGAVQEVQARSWCGTLRSWCLPAGEYRFETRYETPGLRNGGYVSLLALLVYVVVAGFCFWRRKAHP